MVASDVGSSGLGPSLMAVRHSSAKEKARDGFPSRASRLMASHVSRGGAYR